MAVNLTFGLQFCQPWAKAARLYSGILVFATLGVYSLSASVVEVFVMYAIGVLGFFMRRYDFPIAPVIFGVILGPLMETQARRALVASGNDLSVFVSRPLTVVLLLIAIAALVAPFVLRRRGAPPITAED